MHHLNERLMTENVELRSENEHLKKQVKRHFQREKERDKERKKERKKELEIGDIF